MDNSPESQTDAKAKGIKIELDILRKEGFLVEISVEGTSMFQVSVDWGELGVPKNDLRKSRFTTARKYLLPAGDKKAVFNRLKSIETGMRNYFDRYSSDVVGFRPYRWLHHRKFETWYAKWKEQYADFLAIKQEIIDNRDAYIADLAQYFRQIGEIAWESQMQYSVDGIAILHGLPYADRESFLNAIGQVAFDVFPTVEDIQDKLIANWSPAIVYGEADVENDRLEAERLHNARVLENAETQHQLVILNEEERHQAALDRAAEQERWEHVRAMRDIVAEKAQEELAKMRSPLDALINEMLESLEEDVEGILESLKANNGLKAQVANKGKTLLQTYELFGSMGNQQLLDRLSELKKAIESNPPTQDKVRKENRVNAIASRLDAIRITTKLEKQRLVKAGRFDVFSSEMKRKAQAEDSENDGAEE